MCSKCNKNLVTSIEIKLNFCSNCIPQIVEESKEIINKHKSLQQENINLNQQIKIIQEARNLRIKLNKAEEMGKEGSIRLASLSENPFTENTEEWIFWNVGWHIQTTLNERNQFQAVLNWVLFSIDNLEELAKGLGFEEISLKCELIKQKVANFVTPEILIEK